MTNLSVSSSSHPTPPSRNFYRKLGFFLLQQQVSPRWTASLGGQHRRRTRSSSTGGIRFLAAPATPPTTIVQITNLDSTHNLSPISDMKNNANLKRKKNSDSWRISSFSKQRQSVVAAINTQGDALEARNTIEVGDDGSEGSQIWLRKDW